MRALLPRAARPRVAAALASLAALAALPAPAAGQVVDELPPQFSDLPVDQWLEPGRRSSDPRYREQVFLSRAEEIASGRWIEVFESLAGEVRSQAWPGGEGARDALQRELDLVVAGMRRAWVLAELRGPPDTTDEISRVMDALASEDVGPAGFQPQVSVEGDGFFETEVTEFFSGRPWALRPYETVAEGGAEDLRFRLLVPPEAMEALRLYADTARALLSEFYSPVRQANVAAIHLAESRWANFLERGYSQYPWEAWINGLALDFSALEPPRRQWIVLHPSLGVELSTEAFDEVRAEEVLGLEVLGHLVYLGNENENYFGGSLALTLREDLGPGVGALFHVRRHVNLGITWHDADDDGKLFDDDPFVFLSLDLFRFAETRGRRLREAYGDLRQLAAGR